MNHEIPSSLESLRTLWHSGSPDDRDAVACGIGQYFNDNKDASLHEEVLRNLSRFLTNDEVADFYREVDGKVRLPEEEWRDRYLAFFPDAAHALRASDVLLAIDGFIDEGYYPILGHDRVTGSVSVGIRLHAYASPTEWALACELNLWEPVPNCYDTVLYVYESNGYTGYLQSYEDITRWPLSPIGHQV